MLVHLPKNGERRKCLGGRGSASGISDKGRKYGTEYRTLFQSNNIKFIKYDISKSATSPYETRSNHRIYVTINNKNEPKYITMYRNNGKRLAQIDISGPTHTQDGRKFETPHIHVGYEHQGSYVRNLNFWEKRLLSRTKNIWYNKRKDK